jgi:Tfp pilus assembly protein FimV
MPVATDLARLLIASGDRDAARAVVAAVGIDAEDGLSTLARQEFDSVRLQLA